MKYEIEYTKEHTKIIHAKSREEAEWKFNQWDEDAECDINIIMEVTN